MAERIAAFPSGRRAKWVIVVFWAVVFAGGSFFAGKLASVEKNSIESWLPASAESTKVIKASAAFQNQDIVPGIVVYERKSGVTREDLAKVTADVEKFQLIKGVDGKVQGPIPSVKTNQAIQVYVPINMGGSAGWDQAGEVAKQVREIAKADANGMVTHFAGPGGEAADQSTAFAGIDGTLLFATLAIVIVLLLATYRSPILWLFPLLSAVVALTVAQAVIYFCAKYFDLTVNAMSAGILTVLVLGAGTDYALLLVARYREELRRHSDRHEAMAVALHRAGPAIIASAATVAIGLLCLSFADMNSTAGLGPVSAIGIATGLIAMITLLPAMLVIGGRWLFWPVKPKYGSTEPSVRGVWAKVGNAISHRPRIVWVLTALLLGGLVFGLSGFKATGLTSAQQFRGKPDSIVGGEVLARHFDAGGGAPVVVIGNAADQAVLRSTLAGTEGIDPDSVTVAEKNGKAYVTGTPTAGAMSKAAFDIVDRARDRVHSAVPGALVGGMAATNLDSQRAAQRDNKVIIPIVLIVVFLILMMLLRAVVAPLLLIATVVLSFFAALGVSALAFKHLFDFAGADSSYPLLVFVFLVALGIDYNIFLMTRVREETQKHGTRRGMLTGLTATGGVITSAGLVLAGTFVALGSLPLVVMTELGFAVALGVLLDTIVVRSVLVPAMILDLGRWTWWPSKLAQVHDEPTEDNGAGGAIGPLGESPSGARSNGTNGVTAAKADGAVDVGLDADARGRVEAPPRAT